MLNDSGGVVDDLIAYRRAGDDYRLVVNAATRENDLRWLQAAVAGFDATVTEQPELMMLAVQGPQACAAVAPLLPEGLRDAALALDSFASIEAEDMFVARTGYTGEDGWEIVLPADQGLQFWDDVVAAGIGPCGLGARDTLRLEAGLCLYGQDMDESTSPLVSGLGWTVAWSPEDRDFTGRRALMAERENDVMDKLVGLILEDRGIMRHDYRVITDAGEGRVTSGGFSPTLQRSIGLARLPAGAEGSCQVEIRNAQRQARIVQPAFVRKGQILVELPD